MVNRLVCLGLFLELVVELDRGDYDFLIDSFVIFRVLVFFNVYFFY